MAGCSQVLPSGTHFWTAFRRSFRGNDMLGSARHARLRFFALEQHPRRPPLNSGALSAWSASVVRSVRSRTPEHAKRDARATGTSRGLKRAGHAGGAPAMVAAMGRSYKNADGSCRVPVAASSRSNSA
jgi:hypothetical protein